MIHDFNSGAASGSRACAEAPADLSGLVAAGGDLSGREAVEKRLTPRGPAMQIFPGEGP